MQAIRLIDANALNEKIKYAFPTEYGKSVYIRGIVDSMPTIEPEVRHSEWIPCSERLPEQSGFYLACFTFKDGSLLHL